MKTLLIIFYFISFYCHSGKSEHKNEIYWLSSTEEDLVMLAKKTNIPDSIVIDTTRMLMDSLPQYQFNIQFAQRSSITRLLKKLPNSCSPNRVKTDARLKDNIYSSPLNIALGLRLYSKKGAKSKIMPSNALNQNNEVISLPSLFTGKSTYTLGVNKGRSLGSFLDNQIAQLDKHNLMIRSGSQSTLSLIKMLMKGRIDYMIDYPVSVNRVLNGLKTPAMIESVKVVGSPSYIIGYIACNKGPIGERTIREINTSLQQLYRSPDFYQAHTRYLDKHNIADFNQAYREIFQVEVPERKNLNSTY